jgi:hypothetical protein
MTLQLQNKIEYDGMRTYTTEQLLEAARNASNHQFELNTKRVDSLTKSIIKDAQLWEPPTVTDVLGTLVLTSGRHRLYSMIKIIRDYGMNAAGKLVLKTPDTAYAVESFEDEILCFYSRADLASANKLMISRNGSRSMPDIEQKQVLASVGVSTPAGKFKLDFSERIVNEIDLPVGRVITRVTAASIVGKLSRACKPLMYATGEQLDAILLAFQQFLYDNSSDLPENFALGYGDVIDVFLDSEMEDEDGATVRQYLNTYVHAPTKTLKGKSSAAATIAELNAKIAELLAKHEELGL